MSTPRSRPSRPRLVLPVGVVGVVAALVLPATPASAAGPFAVGGRTVVVTVPEFPTTVPVRIQRAGDTSQAASVTYRTVDGTARAGVAYRPAAGILTIPAGQTGAVVTVEVLGRTDRRASSFEVQLSGPVATAAVDTLAAVATTPTTTGPAVEGALVVDVDGDTRPDVVTSNYSRARLDVSLSTTAAGATTPSFAAPVGLASVEGPYKPIACDVNSDGRPDLVAAGSNTNRLTVETNTTTVPGTVSFTRTDVVSLDFGFIRQTACADVDRDGRLDLVGASRGSSVSPGSSRAIVFRNLTPAGATTPVFATPVGFAATATPSSFSSPATVTTPDVNGDDRPDIALGTTNPPTVQVLLNTTPTGSSALSFATPVGFGVGEAPADMATVDLNADGRPDLVTTNFTGTFGSTVAILMNRTAPGAATPSFSRTLAAAGGTPYGVAVADMDLDGRPDVVTTLLATGGGADGSLQVLLNRTAPGASAPQLVLANQFPAGDEPHAVALGDLNADTVPDLVTAEFIGSASSGPLRVLTQQRATTAGTVRSDATVVLRR